MVAPTAIEVAPTVPEQVVASVEKENPKVVEENASEEVAVKSTQPKLTHDQMMEINIKVAFFFITTMIAGILITYIYHRLSMSKRAKEHRISL